MNPDYKDYWEGCPCCKEKQEKLDHIADHFKALIILLGYTPDKEDMDFHLEEINHVLEDI